MVDVDDINSQHSRAVSAQSKTIPSTVSKTKIHSRRKNKVKLSSNSAAKNVDAMQQIKTSQTKSDPKQNQQISQANNNVKAAPIATQRKTDVEVDKLIAQSNNNGKTPIAATATADVKVSHPATQRKPYVKAGQPIAQSKNDFKQVKTTQAKPSQAKANANRTNKKA